ncbi:MAG: hypothetical protein H0V53_09565 [Rubrobacter sp.]|nr:hypothetical protein [Rubrobacter sp.]
MDTTTIHHTTRIEQELSRLRTARPALDSRISRAEHILTTQLSVSNGTRPVKVRLHADGSRSYTVRSGSKLSQSYSVDPGSFSCECPDAHKRGKGCKHAIACYIFARAVFSAALPTVAPESTPGRDTSRESFAGTYREPAEIMAGLARMAG